MRLAVALEHRQRGVGGTLFENVIAFSRDRSARLIYTAYFERPDGLPAAAFLAHRGFVELERFLPSHLDVTAFNPMRFTDDVQRVEAQGVRLFTYADVPDTPENRRRLYELEQAAHATQPFREVEPYVAEPYEEWERGFQEWDPSAVFLAAAPDGAWVGLVSGLEWYFTGVHPDWRGKGIATALKVKMITVAKERGIAQMPTENHGDNAAMIAVNRKLGFIFDASEIAVVKWLTEGS
jgi:GNAT superfamily N-acetyltransferase